MTHVNTAGAIGGSTSSNLQGHKHIGSGSGKIEFSSSNITANTTMAAASPFCSIEEALRDIRQGKFVVVMDNEDRENEGDLIMPAQCATPAAVAFMVRYCSGVICAPTTPERLKELNMPPMVSENTEAHRCAFTVSVDYRHGTSTGISASDRSKTIQAIADPSVKPDDFNRPGHIFPLKYAPGGVIARAGHTEASVDLAVLAGFYPAAFLCELNHDDGTMMRRAELEDFSKVHGLPMITISELIRFRLRTEEIVTRVETPVVTVKTPFGDFVKTDFQYLVEHRSISTLSYGTPSDAKEHVVYCVDSGLEGSIATSWAQKIIAEHGLGVVIYITDRTQLESVSGKEMAEVSIGGVCCQLLKLLGVKKMKILGSTVTRHFEGYGIDVSSAEPLPEFLAK